MTLTSIMDYPYDANTVIQQLVKQSQDVAQGMQSLCALYMNMLPHPVWMEIAELDFKADVERLTGQLTEILTQTPPGARIQGYYFGLLEDPIGGDADQGWTHLRVCGSANFDPDDADWACDPQYVPDQPYLYSQVLDTIYRRSSALDEAYATLGTDDLFVTYTALALSAMMKSIRPDLLLGKRKLRLVGFGHDEGDCITLGKITQNGFVPGWKVI